MKNAKTMMKKISMLMMALLLVCSLMPFQADAAVRDGVPALCVAFDSNGDAVNATPGIPIALDSGCVVITSAKLKTSNCVYGALVGDVYVMEYSSSLAGMDLYTLNDAKSSDCCTIQAAALNTDYTLQVMNTQGDVLSFDIKFVKLGGETSEGLYNLDYNVDSAVGEAKILLPAAVLDNSGKLVGIIGNDGEAYAFAVSEGGSGSGKKDPEPKKETEPEKESAPETPTRAHPEETEPDATQNTPDDTDGGSSGGGSSGGGSSGGGSSEGEESFLEKYLIPILIAGGAVVAAIVVIIVIKSKGKNNQPQNYQPQNFQPQNFQGGDMITRPAGATVPGPVNVGETIPGWEQEPAQPQMSLVDTSGHLKGASFRIGSNGVLIGRASNADVRYPADTKGVSRNHCRVYWQGSALMVVDNGSTSGTYLQGKGQLRTNVPAEVKAGDVIYLGSKKIALTVKK